MIPYRFVCDEVFAQSIKLLFVMGGVWSVGERLFLLLLLLQSRILPLGGVRSYGDMD